MVPLSSTGVWAKLRSFGGTDKFVPEIIEKVVVEGQGIGAIRIIKIKGGGEIIEKLTEIDDVNRIMKFIILYTPMPVSNNEGIFKVTTHNETSCRVYFESVYEVSAENKNEMEAIIKCFQVTLFLTSINNFGGNFDKHFCL